MSRRPYMNEDVYNEYVEYAKSLISDHSKIYVGGILATLIEDEFEEAFSALANKYDYWKAVKEGDVERPPFVLLRLDPSEK